LPDPGYPLSVVFDLKVEVDDATGWLWLAPAAIVLSGGFVESGAEGK